MSNIGKLISGFRVFKSTTLVQKKDVIEHLIKLGQKPSTMVISCVDIRVAPAEIFSTLPGELYVINNIGGLVPKYEVSGVHGILAAIEYAVLELQVENIIILGHAKCDSIKMMMSDRFSTSANNLSTSMKTWLSVATEARDAVKKQLAEKSTDEQQSACENESIILSLRNLMSYPYVSKRMAEDKLKIYGLHFNIETAEIMAFNPDSNFFEPIT